LQLHKADRVKFVRHQAADVIERDAGERGVGIAIGEFGEPILQGAAESRLAGGTRAVDKDGEGGSHELHNRYQNAKIKPPERVSHNAPHPLW
jgi:hypothetical protein